MRIISKRAPLAQLDRATAFEAVGCGFESLRARHFFLNVLFPKREPTEIESLECVAKVIQFLWRIAYA